MKKLLKGIVDFRKNVRESVKVRFAELALGQRPDTLFIACSDSRVVPNLFASSDPGDLLVIRNVGNLVPPCGEHGHSASDESEAAAIEFALLSLKVPDIVICGHSECGAMTILSEGREKVQPSNLKSWLRHGDVTLQRLDHGIHLDPDLETHNLISQLNVLTQIEHLKTYPIVRERLESGSLRLHAWWFDIREADVYEYETSDGRFHLIDDVYAHTLLSRANQERKQT